MKKLIVLLLFFPLVACGFPEAKLDVQASLPLELAYREGPGGLVLIKGRVNDRADVEFVLDTGAPVTVIIDGKRTRGLGLDTREARPLGDPDDPATPVAVVQPGFRIAFGAITLSGLSAVVIPESRLPCLDRIDAVAFGGVVGADLFKKFVVEIDPVAKRVRLHDPAAWRAPTGAASVPLRFRGGHASLPVKLAIGPGVEIEQDLHFDTGMNKPVTLVAGSHPSLVMPKQGAPRKSCLVNGTQEERLGPPVGVSVGGERFTVDSPIYSDGTRVKVQKNGAIGLSLFGERRIAIDYPGKQVVIL